MLTRHKITPENHLDWKQEYKGRKPDMRVAKLAHGLMDFLYKPTIHFVGDAQQSLESLPDDQPWIVAGKHSSNHDSNILASALEKRTFLRDKLTGKTNIMGKPPLLNSILGRFYRAMGVFPGMREEDVVKTGGNEPTSPEILRVQRESADDSIDIATDHVVSRRNLLMYVEGKRNKWNVLEVMKIKRGIGRVAYSAQYHGVDPAIVPFAVHYNNGPDNIRWWQLQKARHADIVFGEPITGPFESVDNVRTSVHAGLVACMETVIPPQPQENPEQF